MGEEKTIEWLRLEKTLLCVQVRFFQAVADACSSV
jgi:hypothetical protein